MKTQQNTHFMCVFCVCKRFVLSNQSLSLYLRIWTSAYILSRSSLLK